MSKRQFDMDYPGPNIVVVPTSAVTCVCGTCASDPPPKMPKLAESIRPPIPGEVQVELDTIPVPPPPLPPGVPPQTSETVCESAKPIENKVHSATTNEDNTSSSQAKMEENVSKTFPETEVKKEVEESKSSSRQQSWASNYLMSIGLPYKKPIKLNLSSSRKSFNAAPEETNKTGSTSEDILDKPLTDNPEKPPKENTVENPFDPPQKEPLVPTCNTIHGIISHSEMKAQPNFENNLLHVHPRIVHVDENRSFPNLYTNTHSAESLYASVPFTEPDRKRDLAHYRPAEDKSYLDKVEQFLAKISDNNNDYETKSKHEIKPRITSLSLKHCERAGYTENPPVVDNKTLDDIKLLQMKSRDILKERAKHYHYEEKYAYKSQYSRQNEHQFSEFKENSSKSKQNYITAKYKTKHNFTDEYNKRRESKEMSNSSNRSVSFRRKSPPQIPISQVNKIYKSRKRSDSSSSSEFVRSRSPCHIHRSQCKDMYKKRERSNSSSCFENGRNKSTRGVSKTTQHKKYKIRNECRAISSSSCHSDSSREVSQHCTRRSKVIQKQKSKRTMSNSSSNTEKNCDKSDKKTLGLKKHKSRRELSSSSSSDSGNSLDKSIRKTQKAQENKNPKSRRELSDSSSNSEKSRHKSARRIHKSRESKKHTAQREMSNSSCNSDHIHKNQKHESKIKHKRDKYDESNRSSKTKDGHKIFDDKKLRKVIKEIVLNDKISTKVSNRKDKYTESQIISKLQKNKSRKYTTEKQHSNIDENESNRTTPLKSVVQVKDTTQLKHSNETFDLRSKLSRKTLSQCFSKICDKNNENLGKKLRENLIIKVANQNEDKEKNIKTACDKIIEINKKKVDSSKSKKVKEVKLVISVICEESGSSDSDGEESKTVKVIKEKNEEGSAIKTVINESNLSNEELSFLDDLNIDEIVDSLTRNKNELSSLKNDLNDAIIAKNNEIDTYNLLSDSEHSDASTVHLEELNLRDDMNRINTYEVKSDDDLCEAENNNTTNQSHRIDENSNISQNKTPKVVRVHFTVKSEKEKTVNQDVKISEENQRTCELPTRENIEMKNKIERIGSKNTQDSNSLKKVKEEPTNIENERDVISANNTQGMTANNNISINDIKQERVDEVRHEGSNIILDTTNDIQKIVENKYNQSNNTPVYEIKEEPKDSVLGKGIATLDPKNKVAKLYEEMGGIKNIDKQNNIIPENEIKKESPDEISDEGIKTFQNKNKDMECELSSEIIDVGEHTNKCIPDNITYINKITEEPLKDVANKEKNTFENKNKDAELELIPTFPTIEIKQEMLNKISHENTCNSETTEPISEQYLGQEITENNKENTEINNKTIEDEKDLTKPHKLAEIKKEPEKRTEDNSARACDIIDLTDVLIETEEVISLSDTDIKNDSLIVNKNNMSNETSIELSVIAPVLTNIENSLNSVSKSSETTDTSGSQKAIRKSETVKDVPSRITQNIEDKIPDTELKIKNSDSNVPKEPNKSQNQNIDDNSESSKSEEHQKLAHGQDPVSNNTEKKNLPAPVTAVKSRSHSPITTKKTESNIKAESAKRPEILGLRPNEKPLVERLEERMKYYFREPYIVTSLLHRGKFSKIYKCENSKGENYVMKLLRTKEDYYNKGIVKERLLVSLQKDIPKENMNFVRFVKGLAVAGLWCFVMEYYPKNLKQALDENKKSFHICKVQNLSRQLVAAVTVMRNNNIVHSDIKSSHIMLNSTNDRLKLCGFDSASLVDQVEALPNVGTVNYRAPEIILGYSAGYSIDVWSTALVMFEMATRRLLFPGHSNNDILFKQMCTLGYMPFDMIKHSRFGHYHYTGPQFMRRGTNGQIHIISEGQIYKNNILRATINTTYHREWAKGILKKRKSQELALLESFCQLLEDMLTIHPYHRLPIEFVYAHPFLFEAEEQ